MMPLPTPEEMAKYVPGYGERVIFTDPIDLAAAHFTPPQVREARSGPLLCHIISKPGGGWDTPKCTGPGCVHYATQSAMGKGYYFVPDNGEPQSDEPAIVEGK